jgi:hypothetical protein
LHDRTVLADIEQKESRVVKKGVKLDSMYIKELATAEANYKTSLKTLQLGMTQSGFCRLRSFLRTNPKQNTKERGETVDMVQRQKHAGAVRRLQNSSGERHRLRVGAKSFTESLFALAQLVERAFAIADDHEESP